MSDISMLSARFDSNQQLLKDFIKAIQSIQLNKSQTPDEKDNVSKKLLVILIAIKSRIRNEVEQNFEVEDYSIVTNLQKINEYKYDNDWNQYSTRLMRLIDKINEKQLDLDTNEIAILNDIAEALDNECDQLFNQMRG